jgi:tetratricopeptide (TPR) repeat protein
MKSDLIENRQIRVFISSTFKDMQAERDYLVQKVFPGLRRYCEERDVTFQEIDLRWGISEEESTQGKVVDICLKEIQKTTPFFIGLLGERYGWVPSPEECDTIAANTPIFEDHPWVKDELANGTSVTEIEIQEGVLRSPEKINAYFYFRSPRMEVPDTDDFNEKNRPAAAEKLIHLKQKLRSRQDYPVEDYDSIEHLGGLVEKDFKTLVDRLYPQGALSPLEKERFAQSAYQRRMTAVYVPVPETEKAIDDFVASAERGLVITGETGSGKSAILAQWIQNREERWDDKVIYHFIGQSDDEGDYRKIIRRLIGEIQDRYNIPSAQQEQSENIDDRQKKELEELLFAVRNKGRLVIILDGLDKLSGDDAKKFKWLPIFPDTCKFIFSTQESDAFSSKGYQVIKVKALNIEARKTLVEKYLESFAKKLTPPQIERIANDKENENPLALRILLDELRIFGKHEELDARIGEYLGTNSIPELLTMALDRCEKTYNYDDKVNFVREVLSLLYVARRGLSEREIRDFTGAAPLYWSQLFNGLAGHLMDRSGMITLSHEFIRAAVKNRYLPDDAAVNEYRKKFAESLSAPDIDISPTRKYEEMAHQLFECADWDALYRTLLDFKIVRYLDVNELAKFWSALCRIDQNKYVLKQYLRLSSEGRSPAKMAELFLKLCEMAATIGFNFAAIAFADETIRLDINNTAVYIVRGNIYYGKQDYEKAVADYNEAIRLNPNYATAWNNRGSVYQYGKKDYDRAIADFTEAIRCNPNFAMAYCNRGQAYMNGKKDYDRAIADFTEAIRCNPNFAMAYYSRGVAYHLGKRDYDRAITDYTEALHINPDDSNAANNLTVARNEKENGTWAVRTIKKIVFGLIILAGMSYIADGLDKGWLHSLAIIFNIAGIVWFVQTIIKRTIGSRLLSIMPQNAKYEDFLFRHGCLFLLSLLLVLVLDIGASVYFVKGRTTGNPTSIFLQNPFEAARKRIFSAGKNDTTDMGADILPPDSQEVNSTSPAGETADKGVKR